jgi:hypothetical protein
MSLAGQDWGKCGEMETNGPHDLTSYVPSLPSHTCEKFTSITAPFPSQAHLHFKGKFKECIEGLAYKEEIT